MYMYILLVNWTEFAIEGCFLGHTIIKNYQTINFCKVINCSDRWCNAWQHFCMHPSSFCLDCNVHSLFLWESRFLHHALIETCLFRILRIGCYSIYLGPKQEGSGNGMYSKSHGSWWTTLTFNHNFKVMATNQDFQENIPIQACMI